MGYFSIYEEVKNILVVKVVSVVVVVVIVVVVVVVVVLEVTLVCFLNHIVSIMYECWFITEP